MRTAYALPNKMILKDRYRLSDILGANGLSITYKAYDTIREKPCVVKELFPEAIVTRSPEDKMRVELVKLSDEALLKQMAEHMIRQAKTMIKLFPLEGIANVITYFEENNTVYVISEYVEGAPLSDFLEHRKAERFELASILNFFSPMTDSLQILHENRVYHGKIRPDQIMVTRKNGVRLVGFTDPMEDVVRPAFLEEVFPARDNRYSSVEQFMEEGKLGAYTDVYGLAATVYHCITRNEPMDFYDRIGKRDRMQAPLDLKVDITEKQNEVVMKGLAPYEFERYQSVRQWLEDIYNGADSDTFKEAKPVVLYRPPIGFLQKQRTKHTAAAAAVLVLVIALLAALPRITGGIRNMRALHFYARFVKEDLYDQCESLKWLGSDERAWFANDYTRQESGEALKPVYYDVRRRKLVDRNAFDNKGLTYEFVEIDYREDNYVIVVFYDRTKMRTLMIDLNNLGEAYQVTEMVESAGSGITTRSLSVDKDGGLE
ncbi:MAG: protein kinase [Lachnospiraceae bacterium]|nr:protein kinase [Lachnospiraceae bacterium]